MNRWLLPLALPLVGLALLLARPETDAHWEDHPAHFWLVLLTALISVVLGYLAGEAARRLNDARLFLVSLAFVTSAGFLGLHALATPGVLLEKPNAGFVVATPVGLVIASVFAAASALDLSPAASAAVMRRQLLLRGAVFALLGGWAVLSLAELPPLDRALTPEEDDGPLYVLGAVGLPLYAFAAVRYVSLYRRRPVRDAARRRRRLHAPRRGDARDRARPRLARVVVGVACADGDRVRHRRRRRPHRVQAPPICRRGLQGPLSRAHGGASSTGATRRR